jgi:hypothetical protein
MAGAIGPGDWVECVEGAASPYRAEEVHAGVLYQVIACNAPFLRRCVRCGALAGPHGLVVEGQKFGWCPTRFRPIYRPKSSLIESLLIKADEPARADA